MSKQFVVHLSGKQRHLMTEELIRTHVDYLRSLKLQEKLPFCGPCVDGTALMILTVDSEEEALNLLEADPFSKVDYYQNRHIVEIEEATLDNNFHLDEVVEYLQARA